MSDQTDVALPEDSNGFKLPIPAIGAAFPVAYDASAASSVLSTYSGAQTVALRITPTSDCFVTSAAAPTALADGSHHFLPAGIPQDFRFPANHKVAFIKLAAAGSAYCTVLR